MIVSRVYTTNENIEFDSPIENNLIFKIKTSDQSIIDITI